MDSDEHRRESSVRSPSDSDALLGRADLRSVPQEVLHDLVEMQESDRRLVAYEIHDGLAQQLTATVYSFQLYEQLRDRSPQEAQDAFRQAMESLHESLAEARRLINGLRPPILDDHGIVDAIDYLVCEAGKRGDLTIEFHADFPPVRLTSNLENTLFRIVQESLTNIRKHSQSPKAEVTLRREQDRILLKVQDWGKGFDREAVADDRFGLRSINDRAALLGGRAEIRSTPGEGTEVIAELPFETRVDPDGE